MLRDADEVLGRICRVFRRRIKDAGKKVFLILDKPRVHRYVDDTLALFHGPR